MFKHFGGSLIFTVFALALGGWYGWELTGTVDGALGILWICAVLAVLEVSLSFDNAAVNASVLKDMDPVWQRRFLTRSEEHTSELQSLMRISYAVFCLKQKISNITSANK